MPDSSPRESAYSTYHDERTTIPPTYRTPMVERPGTRFIPYRGGGGQYHGVYPLSTVEPEITEDVEGGKVVTEYFEPATEDVQPVPVRIVSEAVSEFGQWRAYQAAASEYPSMVVGRKEGRQRVTVRNISTADKLWIGPDNNVNVNNGYPLFARDDVTLIGEAEIWAIRDTGVAGTVPIAIMLEFSTAQH